MLLQVKANKRGGAFHNFRPTERASLRAEAAQAGAEAILVHWPHGVDGEEEWFREDAWP